MISIGSAASASSLYRTSTTRTAATSGSFDAAMTQASSAPASTGDVAVISDAAKAQSVDPMAKYYNEVPIQASPDKVAEWRAAGAALSRAQGLPDGQYDFSRMNSQQLGVVIEDYTAKGVSQSRLNGLMTAASQMAWNEEARAAHGVTGKDTIDVTAWIHGMYEADVRDGGVGGREARFTKGSLDLVDEMTKIVGSGAKASADANDSIAKLNDAIAHFKKEASLTPAQRARRDVLKTMNLTEDAIKAMSPEQQKATEQKIADAVAERLRLNEAGKAQAGTGDAKISAVVTLSV